MQRQTAVTAYFSSKQLLLFAFVEQYGNMEATIGLSPGNPK